MRGKKWTITGWALYDFANTIFSMNIISLYFVLWVTIDKAGEDILYSIALSGSLFVAAVMEPLLGTISDIYKKRMPFLIFFTCLACLLTIVLGGVKGVLIGLFVFALANIAFQTAAVFYNALLAFICDRKEIGRVSGLGVGLGYVGAITGLLATKPFALKYGYQAAFIPTAVLFFIFSLPCFILVKETPPVNKLRPEMSMGKVYRRIKGTFVDSERYPGLRRFLLGAFIFLNAVNTAIVFMSVYVKKVGDFPDSELIPLYIVSTVMAIAGALVSGIAADKLGAKRAVIASLVFWMFAIIAGSSAFTRPMFWTAGPLMGIALGSIWTTSRAWVVKLCPEEKIGEVFGLLGTVGKSAAIVGPLVWGLSILVFGFMGVAKYRMAMLIQGFFILLGWLVIRGVPEDKAAAE